MTAATMDDWSQIVAEIIARAGLLVTAHDEDDARAVTEQVEGLRVLLVAWHSPRDDWASRNKRKARRK